MKRYAIRVTAHGAVVAAIFLALFFLFVGRNGAYLPSTLKVCFRAEPRREKPSAPRGRFRPKALKDAPLPDGELILSLDVGRGLTAYRNLRSNSPVGLPQLPVRGLSLQSPRAFILESVTIRSPRGSIAVPLRSALARGPNGILAPPPKGAPVMNAVFSKIDPRTRYVSPLLISVQALLALVLACVASGLLGLRARIGKADWRAVVRYVFLERGHWIFWTLWAVSAGVLTLWLLAEWPGIITPDGMEVWQRSVTLDLDNWHPYLYAVYLIALRQFADSLWPVCVAQILMTASLGAYIFYFLFVRGGRTAVLLSAPFFLLFVLSVPVGGYTITCSKDPLFSILVVFWAFFLYYTSWRKRRGAPFNPGPAPLLVLSLLFVAMCLLRHNGVVMLVVLPAFLWGARLMPARTLVRFVALSVALFVLAAYVVANALGVHSRTDYQRMHFLSLCTQIAALFADRNCYSDDPAGDRRKIEKLISVDEIRRDYSPSTGIFWETEDGRYTRRWYALSREERRDIIGLYYARALPNLDLILANRADVFFSTLGFNDSVFFPANALEDTRDWPCPDFRLYPGFIHAPKSRTLHRVAAALFERARTYRGLWRGRFVYFNLVFPLLCVLASAVLYKWLPSTAIAALFLLVQLPIFIVVMPGPTFRYMYFLYLFGFFLVPMAATELFPGRRG